MPSGQRRVGLGWFVLLLIGLIWEGTGSAIAQPQREVRVVQPSAVVDQSVTVSIELIATGGEQTVQFSLRHDPNLLRRPQVVLAKPKQGQEGSPNETATLLVQSSVGGQLGLTWHLPPGTSLSAGEYSLIWITFRVETEALPRPLLKIEDVPVARQVLDSSAAVLPTLWTETVSSFEPLPTVTLRPAAPTSHDSTTLTLAGVWPNACTPRQPVLLRSERFLRIETQGFGEICPQVLTPYLVAISLGRLDPGIYQVEMVHVLPRGPIRLADFPVSVQAGLTSTNAGNYTIGTVARGSIVAAFGTQLAATTVEATTLPLPTNLGGVTAVIRDVTGLATPAPLFFVSPQQVNYQVPVDTFEGPATLTLTSSEGQLAVSRLNIVRVAPALFTLNGSGQGLPIGYLVRTRLDGSQVVEPFWRPLPGGGVVPRPIPIAHPSEDLSLALYGTGLRFRSALSNVSVTIGGLPAQLLYLGEAVNFVGLDQCNIRLPAALAGRGVVDLELIVDGVTANRVQLTFE
jgi:uncharacterized protein (TIGR03437 family)